MPPKSRAGGKSVPGRGKTVAGGSGGKGGSARADNLAKTARQAATNRAPNKNLSEFTGTGRGKGKGPGKGRGKGAGKGTVKAKGKGVSVIGPATARKQRGLKPGSRLQYGHPSSTY